MARWWEKEQPLRIGSIMQHFAPLPNSPELLNLSSCKQWRHADAAVSAPQPSQGTRCCMEERVSSGTNFSAVLSCLPETHHSHWSIL